MGGCLVRTKQPVRDDGVMTIGQGCRGGGGGGGEEGHIFFGESLKHL